MQLWQFFFTNFPQLRMQSTVFVLNVIHLGVRHKHAACLLLEELMKKFA